MVSNRTTRIKALMETLNLKERLTRCRLENAKQCTPEDKDHFRWEISQAEMELARIELQRIRLEQTSLTAVEARHESLSPGAMFLVLADHPYVIRQDDLTSDDETWYRLDSEYADEKMSFEEAIRNPYVDSHVYHPYNFIRLYTAGEVDNLLDKANVPDTFTWE